MRVVRNTAEMFAWSQERRREGKTIGFVPTMGYLHRGHTSLMGLARPRCELLVASIYVNPLQFGPSEDLGRYPRSPERDAQLCEEAGVDLLFTPEGFYPPGFSTRVIVGGVSERWEGAVRPGHFEGVATVVARLFGLVRPHLAVFGEKDYQQLAVIRTMVRDLALDLEVVGGPLVRDHDGLALSSRNVYLSADQRRRALSLYRALTMLRDHSSPRVVERLAAARAVIDCDHLDYLAIVHPESLEPLEEIAGPGRALVVGRYGSTRLLDNVALG